MSDVLVDGFPCRQDYSVAKPLSSSDGLAKKKGVLRVWVTNPECSDKDRYLITRVRFHILLGIITP